jgi:hypothetical protein
MNSSNSIFLDFALPSATTWFYFSLVLVIALFFKFSRFFSLRNWDLVTLFLLVPALLYLRQGQETRRVANEELRRETASLILTAGGAAADPLGLSASELVGPANELARAGRAQVERSQAVWRAYLGLLIGSAYFFVRCLLELGFVRRTIFTPNLSMGGLLWLGLTLAAVMGVETLRRLHEPPGPPALEALVVDRATQVASSAVGPWIVGSETLACHFLVVLGLVWIGWRHFQNLPGGIGAGVLYLLLPYTAMSMKELTHVLPTAFLVLAVAMYRRPTLAGLWLGLSAVVAYFPVLLLPLWVGFYWRRGVGRFLLAFGLVAAVLGLYLWIGGELWDDLQTALNLPDIRAWDWTAVPTAEGLWNGVELHYAYRVPLFIAHLAFIGGVAFWPAPKNLAHLIALSTAIILGVQFWYGSAGGTYVLWYLPLLILLVIRPNLADRLAPEIEPEHDWARRGFRGLKRVFIRLLKRPPEPVRVGR